MMAGADLGWWHWVWTPEAGQLPLLSLFKLDPRETRSRMWEGSMACEMLFLLLVLFLLSPACHQPWCMLGNKEHSSSRSQVEATGPTFWPATSAHHFQRKPPPPATHTPQRGGYTTFCLWVQGRGRAWLLGQHPSPSRGQKFPPTAGAPSIRFIPLTHSPGNWRHVCVTLRVDAVNYKASAERTKEEKVSPTPTRQHLLTVSEGPEVVTSVPGSVWGVI